ncbi:uncharacterized protein LOC124306864 [Neodiprion virginianus]|uniref:uncharacterized protein LOC124306864 n=1 Tax=Neodiprion virginianus TaxID=2961670 RepID=UPI001EE77526|nr:uncharacterized protein LOC124306864 [Neodiprion virginianus]
MAVSKAYYGISGTPYVSGNAYYGFVPQNNVNPEPGNCSSSCWDVNMKDTTSGNCHGAMETDDEGRAADLVNNYCVIPEALRGVNPAVYTSDDHDHPVSRPGAFGQDRQQACQARYNRKRNNNGELMLADPDQFKRLRKGSGNCCTYHGRTYAKDCGLAEMRCKSARLCINGELKYREQQELMATVNSCFHAAGNHGKLVNHDSKKCNNPLNGNLKLKYCHDDAEYERMLLETHGCSVYHHQRFQSQSGIEEAEF